MTASATIRRHDSTPMHRVSEMKRALKNAEGQLDAGRMLSEQSAVILVDVLVLARWAQPRLICPQKAFDRFPLVAATTGGSRAIS